MKIHVITDAKGRIVATVQGTARSRGKSPTTATPLPLSGQKVREIELPKELEGLRDVDRLHKQLKKHLR